jgi:glycerophosphoryl diester phosphodiesterase
MTTVTRPLIGFFFLAAVASTAGAQQHTLGYIKDIPEESTERSKQRHRIVAEKRARHPLIFHRGAVRKAPENTLECYAAAIDMGADGVEIDIHRTRDGVLVLHHDDKLGRTFEGNGKIKEMSYYELLQAKLKNPKGPVNKDTRLPTLASFLELARQRAILIHLDVKQSGIQDDIIAMIEKADMWDHFVEVNGGNADKIRPDTWNEGKPGPHNKVRLIPYAQNVPLWDGPIEDVRKAIQEYIRKKEAESDRNYMFFGGHDHQERLARIVGNKPVEKPAPLPESLRAWWGPDGFIKNCVELKDNREPAPRVFLMNGRTLLRVRHRVAADSEQLRPAAAKLREQADATMKMKPVSVMDKDAVPPSGDKHDYMSQGSYWWPNPKTPDGLPYVRRDGEYNPECRKLDSRPLHAMTNAVNTLALAYLMTDKEEYADKAAELLRVWFLRPATRMNPHLKYGQAIPGICDGRGIGIIDTACLARLVDAVGLLSNSSAWKTEEQASLQAWFDAYLKWLLTSDHGLDEAKQPNNHGTYYDVQVASFALFVGKKELAHETLRRSAERRIAPQIEPDGRQPWELRRTNAWGYSLMNLSGMFDLATLSAHFDIDLWHYETPDGRGIRKAIDWLAQYADGTKRFEYKHIKGMSYGRLGQLLRRAAIAYDHPPYEALIKKLPDTDLAADRMQLIYPATARP